MIKDKATGYEINDLMAPADHLNVFDKQIPFATPESLKWLLNEGITDAGFSARLEELHCEYTKSIEELKAKLQEESERGDMFRGKLLVADRAAAEKDIAIANMKFEIQKMNTLLEKAHQSEKITDGIMRMYLDTKSKLAECAEGEGRSAWM